MKSTDEMQGPKLSDTTLVRRLIGELSAEKRAFVISLALFLPILATQLGQPLVIGAVVDRGFRAKDLDQVTLWAAVYLGLVTVNMLVEMAQLWVMTGMGQRAVRDLRVRLFAKIQRLPIAYFDRVPLGRVMTRVTNDVESIAELFTSGAVRIVGDLLFLVGTLAMLFIVDVPLSFASLAVMPFLIIGVQLFRTRAREAFAKVRTILSQLNGFLQETLSGMHIVQLFDQVERIEHKFAESNEGYMLANRSAIALDAGVYAFVDAMSSIAVAVVLYVGAGLEAKGALSLGVLVAFIEALGRFFVPIRELSNKYTVIQSALTSAERIYSLFDEKETISEREGAKEATFGEQLAFENVRFAYNDGPDILHGVSFSVKKGEKLALVGHTGSGKSTILKLATRAYDVIEGRVAVDDDDIRSLSLGSVRKLFVSVPQDVFLFSGTIRDNLTFGGELIDDERVLAAARACQADAVLDRHGGLDGKVNERGTNLSLGERQLLALVRALVTDPPILLLDEATASVDRSTERRLQAATELLLERRTAIIVAHRLATIRKCDRILVLHKGEIVEQGSHDELMAAQGRYAMLVELQAREGG
jgi:ATP-binding cassette subfamily B multidrug efflux pump